MYDMKWEYKLTFTQRQTDPSIPVYQQFTDSTKKQTEQNSKNKQVHLNPLHTIHRTSFDLISVISQVTMVLETNYITSLGFILNIKKYAKLNLP